jgi:hypothetical protein
MMPKGQKRVLTSQELAKQEVLEDIQDALILHSATSWPIKYVGIKGRFDKTIIATMQAVVFSDDDKKVERRFYLEISLKETKP